MAYYYYDYPILTGEYRLPLFVITVGLNEWQYHVIRDEGEGVHKIIYCLHGTGTLFFGGESYHITPGMGFVMPRGCPHEYYSNGNIWDTRWVCFDGFAADETAKIFKLDQPRIFTLYETKDLERLHRNMHEAINSDRFYGTYRASGILYSFLVELNRLINVQSSSHGAVSLPLVRAVDYINIHYRERITLDSLSEAAGVSKQYICRLFRDEMSIRPMEYITKRKIQAARELLRTTDKRIDEIAEELGFCSASYFEKMFKRCEGMPAGKFRNS